ncbi:MAG: GNAT family N-acetyltransferase [Kineosporiaceae bacterium]
MDTEMVLRLVEVDDADALAEILTRNREFLAPWEPERDAGYFTTRSQADSLAAALDEHAQGRALPLVILDGDGTVAGRVTLSGIVRGPFQSAVLGYWVDRDRNGRGLATAAVRDTLRLAFTDLRLHRVQAGTLVHNLASQRVLEKNGFVRIGLAPAYLKIAGRWQDHLLFQRVADSGV